VAGFVPHAKVIPFSFRFAIALSVREEPAAAMELRRSSKSTASGLLANRVNLQGRPIAAIQWNFISVLAAAAACSGSRLESPNS
jgi:hypothetical protein